MGLEKDLPPGEHLIALFRPFLEHLAASALSPKTVQKHVDNVWVLGGEFIRDLHNDPPLRKKPVDRLAYTLEHKPRAFLSDFDIACNLVATDAVLAIGNQPNHR